MNWKSWLPFAAAAVLGLVAAKFGWDVIASHTHTAPAPSVKVVHIAMAAVDINAGSAFKPTDLIVGDVPTGSVPGETFSDVNALINRVPSVPLVKGQAILETMLTPKGTPNGLPAVVPDGMRAITLDVNEVSGVAGMLLPGCHVDLIMTIMADKDGPTMARTVADNVEVLAVGQKFGPPSRNPQPAAAGDAPPPMARSITLLVTPEQAHVVELAGKMGNPRFVLRGSTDLTPTADGGATLAQLRTASNKAQTGLSKMLAGLFTPAKSGERDATGSATDAVKGWTVQVIRAGVESQVIIPMKPEVSDASRPAAKPEGTPAAVAPVAAPGVVETDLSPVVDPRSK